MKAGLKWAFFLIGFVAVAALVVSSVLASYLLMNNTLANDGQWISLKEDLELFANGATSYMRGTQALARGRLNLGAWAGFQELLYKPKVPCQRISFDFLLPRGAYFTFFIEHDLRAFRGIRLSQNPVFPSAYLTGHMDGEFTNQRIFPLPNLLTDQWHHASIEFDNGESRLAIDGVPVATGSIPAPSLCCPGFRGCLMPVYIDNLRADDVLLDNFFEDSKWRQVLLIAVAAVLFQTACLLAALKMADVSWSRSAGVVLAFTALVALIGMGISVFLYYYAERYPNGLGLHKSEEIFLAQNSRVRHQEIRDEAANAVAKAGPDASLIMFIGTSQTYGAGATKREDTWVAQVQLRLDAATGGTRKFWCINAGMSGSCAENLFLDYQQEWVNLKPRMVVINLANNDGFRPDFGEVLRRFIVLNQERGIRTVLALEPNSIESADDGLPLHPIMREVGQEFRVPVIELHQFMCQNHDKGFLWWDTVHATSYGQKLMADCVAEAITPLLEKK